MKAADRLTRAASIIADMELSPRTDAILSALALVVVDIACTSPGDQADKVEVIAGMMRG